MIKNKKISNKITKTTLLTGLVVLLVLGIVGLELTGVTNFYGSDTVKVTPQDGLTEEQTKQQVTANLENKQKNAEQTEGSSPAPATKNIELSARQEDNGTVTVFSKLFGYTSGTCELIVTNGSKRHQQTAEVIFQPEYSSCAGFSVPAEDLGAGDWNIRISVSSNAQTAEKTLTFKVQ